MRFIISCLIRIRMNIIYIYKSRIFILIYYLFCGGTRIKYYKLLKYPLIIVIIIIYYNHNNNHRYHNNNNSLFFFFLLHHHLHQFITVMVPSSSSSMFIITNNLIINPCSMKRCSVCEAGNRRRSVLTRG